MTQLDIVISNIEIPLENGEKAGLVLSIYDCQVGRSIGIQHSQEHTEFGWFAPQEAAQLLSYKYPAVFREKVSSSG